ncbi:translation initiation factor IF-2 N-terminal domain-containing protein, partial [Amnibacterium flavum]
MAAKPRVHEVASDLGIDTKVALAKLKEMGEFVKGPSSSIEPPVVRKLKARLEADGISGSKTAEAAPAAAAPAARTSARPGPAAPKAPAAPAAPA